MTEDVIKAALNEMMLERARDASDYGREAEATELVAAVLAVEPQHADAQILLLIQAADLLTYYSVLAWFEERTGIKDFLEPLTKDARVVLHMKPPPIDKALFFDADERSVFLSLARAIQGTTKPVPSSIGNSLWKIVKKMDLVSRADRAWSR